MTSGRTRRLAAITMIGLALGVVLGGCGDGDRRDKAGAPKSNTTASSAGSGETSQPGLTAPGENRSDFGLADAAAALGAGAASAAAGTPGAPGRSQSASGGAPVGGGSPVAGGAPAADGSPGGAAAAQGGSAPPAAADTGPGSGGGAARGPDRQPTISATPEECAMLRQLLAIIEHPQLRQLQVDTGC